MTGQILSVDNDHVIYSEAPELLLKGQCVEMVLIVKRELTFNST